MDYNDLLKAIKRALDEMSELAMTENLEDSEFEKFNTLKDQVRNYDQKIEMMDAVREGKKNLKETRFTPELDEKKVDRSILNFEGSPAHDRTFSGMFNQGRELEINEDEIKQFRASMVEGTPSSGGFAVPEPVAAKWLDDSLPSEIIRPKATVWPMTSATRKVPAWDGADQTSNYYGGFAMEFLAEEATGTKQTGKLRQIQLSANKGAIFVDISNELKEDGLGFDAQLEIAIKKSLSLGMDYYFTSGVGSGQPLGVVNSPSIITVAKETGQQADTLVYKSIAKMFARMYPAGRSRGIWLANETCLPELLTSMTVSVGTGGSVVNVFKEVDGKFTLLGRPLLFSSMLPTLGDANDLMFLDLSQYYIGIRRDVRLEKSNIPGWTEDLLSYRILTRFDGQDSWSSAISPKVGDDLSWCIGMGERA